MEESLRTISENSLVCFAKLLDTAGYSSDDIIRNTIHPKLKDDFDRVKVWTGTNGVFHEGPASLEWRLRNVHHLRQHLSKLFNVLNKRLGDSLQIISGEKVPWEKSTDNDLPLEDSETMTEIEQAALDITEAVDRLVRLSGTIENAIMREEFTSPDWTAICIDGPRARGVSVSNYSIASTHIKKWSGDRNSRYDDTSATDDDDGLIIGLDFGTLYSGAAWATCTGFAAREINLITGWPGAGQEEGKVPTQLFYEDDQVLWGYQIPPDADPVRCFKLLLVEDKDLSLEQQVSETFSRGRKFLREIGKSSVEVAADYLRLLFQHTLEVIRKTLGDYTLDSLRFKVVITIPSIWKDNDRLRMEKAVQMAGIMDLRPAGPTNLTFAPEPEAAALSTLCEAGRNPREGEIYIICDAGGGTVDLISYEVKSGDPLRIEEAAEGTGGFCGGSIIDEAFENACKTRLGRKWERLSKHDVKKIMRQWQTAIKFQFRPVAKEEEYIIEIPGEASMGSSTDDLIRKPLIKDGRIHFQGSHLKEVFAGSFNEIEKLVDGQIRLLMQRGAAATGIILTGGLGSSPYLYEHLKAKYWKLGLTIVQSGGMKPRTSICRGAVYRGYFEGLVTWSSNSTQSNTIARPIEAPIKVTATIARSSYGVKYATVFDRMRHLREDRIWDETERTWMATNQMRWYLRRVSGSRPSPFYRACLTNLDHNKGDVVSKESPVRHSFYEYVKANEFDGKINIILWTCDELEPPDRADFRVNAQRKVQVLTMIPFSELPDFRTADGLLVKKLSYEVEMIPSGSCLDFVVYMDGKRLVGHNKVVQFE